MNKANDMTLITVTQSGKSMGVSLIQQVERECGEVTPCADGSSGWCCAAAGATQSTCALWKPFGLTRPLFHPEAEAGVSNLSAATHKTSKNSLHPVILPPL